MLILLLHLGKHRAEEGEHRVHCLNYTSQVIEEASDLYMLAINANFRGVRYWYVLKRIKSH